MRTITYKNVGLAKVKCIIFTNYSQFNISINKFTNN